MKNFIYQSILFSSVLLLGLKEPRFASAKTTFHQLLPEELGAAQRKFGIQLFEILAKK